MKSLRLWFLPALLLCLLPFCFGQAKVVVKPNDTVNVVCEEEPSLSKDYVITRDGFIVMQFIGAVAIAGLDEKAAGAKIAATLIEQRIVARATIKLKIMGAAKGGLINFSGAVAKTGDLYPREGLRLSDVVKEAQPTQAADMAHVRIVAADGKTVIVDFLSFNGTDMANNPLLKSGDRVYFDLIARTADVSVTGMVTRPGLVPFTRGLTVRGAIRASGGLGPGANDTAVRLERDGVAMPNIDIRQVDTELKPGDRVFVPGGASISFITVTGQVKSPQRLVLRQGMTLQQAIDAAGGPEKGADLTTVKITRKVDGKDKMFIHNAAASANGMSGPFDLQANDVIILEQPAKRSGARNSSFLKIAGIAILGILLGFRF